MARRIAVSTLNASTLDILNTIRANASAEYQSLVPQITSEKDIPRVGEVLYGYPALANQFISALVNRIALVRVKSATFNNAYAELKKGYLEFGETVEEVFVNIAKAREFSAEKAESREFKRTLPDVRTAFHSMNYRVQYPVTIQDEDLRMAFLSVEGVQDLIAKIVDSVYTASEYDEYLLFKYLMIKAIAHGKMYPVGTGATLNSSAVAFRSASNQLTFMNTKYNESKVHTVTNKDDQYIFMDAEFNAQFDVNVLASAFNMDKADFMGKLKLIDDWTTFDSDRFSTIVENSDMIDPITDDELALMADVQAVLVDSEWFQIYDNQNKFTEKYVASGEYWNYFYNVWKTVSSSPFSNAIVFLKGTLDEDPEELDFVVESVSKNDNAIVATLVPDTSGTFVDGRYNFVQTQDATTKGIAVHKYGAYIVPVSSTANNMKTTVTVEYNDKTYATEAVVDFASVAVGDSVTVALPSETPSEP